MHCISSSRAFIRYLLRSKMQSGLLKNVVTIIPVATHMAVSVEETHVPIVDLPNMIKRVPLSVLLSEHTRKTST